MRYYSLYIYISKILIQVDIFGLEQYECVKCAANCQSSVTYKSLEVLKDQYIEVVLKSFFRLCALTHKSNILLGCMIKNITSCILIQNVNGTDSCTIPPQGGDIKTRREIILQSIQNYFRNNNITISHAKCYCTFMESLICVQNTCVFLRYQLERQ